MQGVYVHGLRKVVVGSAKMLNDLMHQGTMVRTQVCLDVCDCVTSSCVDTRAVDVCKLVLV